jgi:hypothetical protein
MTETPAADGAYCANVAWYRRGGFKSRYEHLVGWRRNRLAPGPRPTKTRQPLRLSEVKPDESHKARRAADERVGLGWLWSSEAYQCGYHHLYDLLPDCCHCSCHIRL